MMLLIFHSHVSLPEGMVWNEESEGIIQRTHHLWSMDPLFIDDLPTKTSIYRGFSQFDYHSIDLTLDSMGISGS